MKNSIHILALPLASLIFSSCAQQAENYDTPNPYGHADAGYQDPYGTQAPNPVYDTPAAYEDGSSVPTPPPYPNIPDTPAIPPVHTTPAIPGDRSAIIHTVVKGDTLSGLSSKYNVPIASIKQANQMTNDIVVLGRKMVIPPR